MSDSELLDVLTYGEQTKASRISETSNKTSVPKYLQRKINLQPSQFDFLDSIGENGEKSFTFIGVRIIKEYGDTKMLLESISLN